MFLFILESIGTSELILIGIIALIFLGPRKLPQIAKTIGKTMADFRNTTNEFKETWQREVDFESEADALRTGELRPEPEPIPRVASIGDQQTNTIAAPEIKAAPIDLFDGVPPPAQADAVPETAAATESSTQDNLSDKKNWL